MFKVNNKDATSDAVLVSLLSTLNIFHTIFSACIVDFEQLNVYWMYIERTSGVQKKTPKKSPSNSLKKQDVNW